MRRAIAAVALAAAAAAARGDDESRRATVQVSADRTTVYAGEPLRLRVLASFDEVFFKDRAVSLFSRKMDVPLRLDAPWLRGIRGADLVDSPDPSSPTATLAVGDDIERVARVEGRQGTPRPYGGLSVVRTFVAREPGDVTLDAPELRFAYATKFEEDFVDGRRGVDRHDVVVHGEPLTLHVLPLPAERRPATFAGAVGRSLAIRAECGAHDVAAGETFRLTLRIEGDGHLATFAAPRLDGLAGFHVYGMLDDHGASVRTIGYDVAALDTSVREIPAIEWSYYDTNDPPSYRTLRTEPIPITVRPAANAPVSGTQKEPPAADSWLAFVLTVVAAASAVVVTRILMRRRSAAVPDLAAERRVAAAESVASAAASGGDVAAAFTEYLAARLGCAPAAVVGADLAVRLASAGVSDDVARRAASTFDALVASRYGGGSGPDGSTIVAIVDAMEASPNPL